MIKEIFKTLKINHYIKNIIIFVPLIFSQNLNSPEKCVQATIIFLSFSLIASAVYLLNDLIDIEKDKKHPEKCKRPIASGKITKKTAIKILSFLFVVSVFLASILNLKCVFVILGYFLLNIAYSLVLKNIALIDTACIATGFILRILSGCYAISVVPSPLIILLTFFLSMFFTFSKRKLEFISNDTPEQCRPALKELNLDTINQFITINAILSIAFYFTYVLDDKTIEKTGTDLLYISVIPFTLVLFRLIFLLNNEKRRYDPVHFIYNDKITQIFIILFATVLFIILS